MKNRMHNGDHTLSAALTADTQHLQFPVKKTDLTTHVLVGGLLVAGLFWISRYNFLLFHSLSELFSVAVAWAVFLVAWNARRFIKEDALVLLGVAYLFVGGIDLLHTLTYKGMGVFSGPGEANPPTQLWVIARYLESFSLLAFVWFTGKHIRLRPVVAVYAGILVVSLLSVFVWENFPACFVDGSGLTPFKKISEYLICTVLAITALILFQKQGLFDSSVYRLMMAAIALTILGELFFTFYISVYGTSNLAGHFFKIFSFYLIYLALVRSGLTRPQDVVFRQLNQAREQFAAAYNKTPLLMGFSRLDDGTYTHVNDTFVSVTGYSRQEVIGSRSVDLGIISRKDREQMKKELLAKRCIEDRKISLRARDGSQLICRMWADLISIHGQDHLLVMASDITQQTTIESERLVTMDLLRLINGKSDLAELIQGVTLLFAETSGCEAVGIRLRKGDDYPYFETRGFPRSFVTAENFLCARNPMGEVIRDGAGNPFLECMCGNILRGGFDPALPFFTENGSFWSNSTTKLLASFSREDPQAAPQNRCIMEGYESVALIPLRYAGKTFGLVQFNDTRKNRFSKNVICFYERLAGHLALALKERSDVAALFKEKTLMEAVLGSIPDLVVLKDTHGRYQMVNAAFCDFLDRPEPDIIGRTDHELFPSEDADIYVKGDRQVLDSGIPEMGDWKVQGGKGKAWLQVIKTPVKNQKGEIEGVLCSVRDITDSKRAELLLKARLRLSEFARSHSIKDLLKETLAQAEDLTDSRIGFFHFVSEDQKHIHPMQWSNRTLAAGCRIGTADRVSPLDKSGVWADCIRRRKPVIHNEYKAVPGTQGYPQGHVPVIRELTVPVIDNGLVKALLGVGNKKVIYSTHDRALVQELANMTWDIVVRKKIEDQWEALSRRLEIMVGNLPGMVYRCANDPDWTMEYVSQGCLDLTGYQTDDFTGKNPQMTFAGIIHAGHRHRVWDEIQEKISHGASFEIEYPIVHRDGTIRWVWERGVRVEGDDASPDCLEGFITDITHKRKQEAQLRQRAMVIDQAAESIMITDEKGDIQYVNPAFEQITGYPKEEVSGQNPRILKSGNQGTGFYRRLWETIRTGKTWRGRFVNRKKDGVLFTQEGTVTPVLDSSGQIVNYVAVMLDISEDILMEEQLSSAQRMEAIGTLAGGIAHDFNNILFPMVGLSELLQEDLPENSPLQDHVSGILKSGMRARDLVKQILSFSRQDKMEPKAVRLQMIVKEVLKLMRASLPSTITINEDVRDDCPPVLADPTQIHQIVMNLITNAFHAMEETGGELKITLTREKIEAVKIDNFKGSIKEDGVCITVSDTGKGMEKDVCDRIFEPYFTTKAKGKGTGLGLSVVHGIVEKHDGFIRVESRPGSGTTFRIILPCLTDTSSLDAPHEGQGVQGGTERILLVDDEAPIISMVKQQLERMGYRVTARTASLDAIEIFKKQPDRFDLVITDLTMPNMTGDRLTRKIKQVRPDIPVILCTGFSDKINPEKAAAMGIDAYILKPVIRKDIDAAIRRVLNKKVGAVL